MKHAVASLFLTLSTLLLPAMTQAQTPAAAARIGTFKSVEGKVVVVAAGQERTPAPGDGLMLRERIVTGAKGAAAVTLRDGTVLTLGPNANMDLSAYDFNSTTQQGNAAVNLLQGTLRVVTGLLARANPERFKVTTPTSVVGVRGTDFIVEAQAPKARKVHKGSRSPRATMV